MGSSAELPRLLDMSVSTKGTTSFFIADYGATYYYKNTRGNDCWPLLSGLGSRGRSPDRPFPRTVAFDLSVA